MNLTSAKPNNQPLIANIFCKVLDNYGDMGICWRLSQQLKQQYELEIRLWIDNLKAFKHLAPEIDPNLSLQIHSDIIILDWHNPGVNVLNTPSSSLELIIEGFACGIPASYWHKLVHNCTHNRAPTWISLEYLSAERWVTKFHLQPSIHPLLGVKSLVIFPGFNHQTGGLLREPRLDQKRHFFISQPTAKELFLTKIGVEPIDTKHRWISVFCYEEAPLALAVSTLIRCAEESEACDYGYTLLIPAGVFQKLQNISNKKVQIRRIPFLSQAHFDELLWLSDINFVRGEDSLVRALWARKPFIWQVYPQEEKYHLKKMDAFLEVYLNHAKAAPYQGILSGILRDCYLGWNDSCHSQLFNDAFHDLLRVHDEWQALSAQLSDYFYQLPELSEQILLAAQKQGFYPPKKS